MHSRVVAAVLAASLLSVPLASSAQTAGTTSQAASQSETVITAKTDGTIVGRIIDADGALPITGATIEVQQGSVTITTATTAADGSFRVKVPGGAAYSLLIHASGFQATRVPELQVPWSGQVSYQTALQRGHSGLSEIGRVAVATRSDALQTSSTINESVSPDIINSQNYMRAGDVLTYTPGLIGSTGSSQGDSLSISIRGFNNTETSTLLDGHPIGPIGAHGGGYDYQVSPFWGLENVNVIFGSGATGVYGATTIAGAVNFQTINPTITPHFVFQEGFGQNGKKLTAVQATGTYGKLGYALASGVEGTYGDFAPQAVEQNALLGTDLTAANQAANTYIMTGNYNLRNNVGKLVYTFDPKTQLSFTGYFANSWDDKSGNGDNDNNPYAYSLYNANNTIAAGPTNVTLPNGSTATCNNSIAVLSNASAGYSCLSATQYASAVSGPSGGGPGPWQSINNQDYHARLTHTFGVNQVTTDYFVDDYNLDYNRSEAGGGFDTQFYKTYGFLIGDEIASPKNDFAYGYYRQVQVHTGDRYPYTDSYGNVSNYIGSSGEYYLPSSNYYLRDAYSPNEKLSFYANLWLNSLQSSHTNSFDPRLAVVYRLTSADVARVAAGHSNSAPDPFLLYAPPSFNTTPSNLNPVCGPGSLNSIGNVSNSNLAPETADDVDFSYAHRFLGNNTLGVDLYTSYEQNALFGGKLPLSALGQTQVPQSYINQYLARIQAACGITPTTANLAVSTTYNAASARYSGIQLFGIFHPVRHFQINADYNVQSAVYLGVPVSILKSNTTIINGSQIAGVPMQTADAMLEWTNRGLDLALDSHYISVNNAFSRPGYAFANFTIAQTIHNTTLNLAFNNVFNSHVQRWGYFGLGVFQPENQYGQDTNSFQQGTEIFGLPPFQAYFSVTQRI